PAARARERAGAAARGPRPDLWLKKIDSTLRGAVAAEIDALIVEARATGALLCPAFPAQHRTVVDGVLRIAGTPVAETALARDPDFGLGGSNIVAALRAGSPRRGAGPRGPDPGAARLDRGRPSGGCGRARPAGAKADRRRGGRSRGRHGRRHRRRALPGARRRAHRAPRRAPPRARPRPAPPR